MDALVGLFAVGIAGLLLLAVPLAALVALARANQALSELRETRARLDALSRRLAARPPSTPLTAQAPPAAEPPLPGEAAPTPATPAAPPRAEPFPGVPPPQRQAPLRRPVRADFATSLGPKILVGAGGLAVVVFLGLFVRYAWENDWVGPLGRVLSAALFSLGLVAGGLRLMARRYRPLGQGLTAAGFSGLYVTAWAAHEVYGLLSRGVAGALLVGVVACAVLVALRRDARLLAGLAWAGGYLAPVMVSTGEDRAEGLFGYLLLLGAGAVWLDRRRPWPETVLIAALGTLLLYAGWYDAHFTAARFAIAAAGLVAFTGLFALGGPRGGELQATLAGLGVAAGGWGGLAMAGDADRPFALLVLLAVQALLAAFAAARWAWTQAVGAALAALAVLAWHDRFFGPGREAAALALGMGVAAAYVGPLAASTWRARPLGVPGALAHVAASMLAFVVLDRVEGARSDERLFLATLALAFVHLALGTAARARGLDPLHVRVTLGLAATFLTLAIPVGFGLHGTTLAWAAEGVLLLWLGCRQRAPLARALGYGVLALAVCRLFLRHLPLHPDPVTPLLNPAFGTWLGVVVALGIARWLSRRVTGEAEGAWLDGAAGVLLGPLALALLLGLLTAETGSYFEHAARAAASGGDRAGALRAERQGGLAVSVLWTLFATALISAGLALRSLPLFYAAYALFAVTAAKVVLVDLATLPTLYRMLSFLALGVLLLAGAWLNLRFRERLEAPGPPAGG
jgi:uncharacterized membrane protein